MACEFIKYYTEPTKKYTCLSTSLFHKGEYIKVSKDLKPYNIASEKTKLFYNNLNKVNELLLNNIYPENIYFRIYYDKSIFEIELYNELFKLLKKNPKIQLIEYNCKYFKSNDKHIDLFGTLLRFHAIFDEDSKKMDYCVFVDCDNILTDKFFIVFEEFKKSKKLVYACTKITQLNFNSIDSNESNDLFDFIYLLGGLTMIKKDKIFKPLYWDLYFNKMFDQKDLMNIFNYIDFKRYSFMSLLKKDEIRSPSYYSFSYGVDEIWLNFLIKKILKINNKKDKLGIYFTNDYRFNFLLNKLIEQFEYNNIINTEELNLFIKNCNFLQNKNYNNLIKYTNDVIKDRRDISVIYFFNNIKKNYYYNRIYIQNNIRYIIENVSDLLNKRGKYGFYSILSSV
jgi:hypothetical protein